MEKCLEEIILAPGIHKEIGDRGIPTFPDYLSEIEDFKKSIRKKVRKNNKVNKEVKGPSVTFVNQDQSFIKTVRALSTDYPYLVLIGDSGIGKSLILKYVVDVLTGETPIKDVEKYMPETVPLFKDIIKRAKKFENRQYLILPNLAVPFNPKVLSYTKIEKAHNDASISDEFCGEISGFFGSYALLNKNKIRTSLNEMQFRKNIRSRINSMYITLYNQIEEIYRSVKMTTTSQQKHIIDETFALVRLNLPEHFDYDKITGNWQFLQREKKNHMDYTLFRANAGFTNEREGLSKDEIESGLGMTVIPKYLNAIFEKLVYEVKHTDVSKLTEIDKENILRAEAKSYFDMVEQNLHNFFMSEKISTFENINSYLKKIVPFYNPPINVSSSTVDDVLSGLKDITDSYGKTNSSQEVRDWISSIYDYFNENRRILRNTLQDMIESMQDMEIKSNIVPKNIEKKDKHPENKEEDKKDPNLAYASIEFEIKHGTEFMNIEDIMQVGTHLTSNCANTISWSKIGDISSNTLFANFVEADDETPPHMTLTSLGSFFKSGILLFQDSFSDFIDVITTNEGNKKGMREQFLEYLQTGKITLVYEGIQFQLEAPRMILGCDNEDPFNTIHKSFLIRNETGLRGRIQAIYVPSMIDNDAKVRKGTLKVMYDAMDNFNKRNSSGRNIDMTNAAANMLLQSMVHTEGLASLDYREFTMNIEDICAYAISKNNSSITPELLKQRVKDDISVGFFSYVDAEKYFGGYFDLPNSQIGHVNGLSAIDGRVGSIVKVRTYFLPGIDYYKKDISHFELVDIKSEMTDETAIKGYELARDFTKMLLAKSSTSGNSTDKAVDWQLKTYFGESWYGIAGPSASMAIAISMVSALADEPIYKNRFITGTIDPINGDAGRIGGVYMKSLIPLRLKQISTQLQQKNNGEFYFLLPAGNLKELTKESIFDPFNLRENVACIPVMNFRQAYHLLTCGETIKDDDFKNAQKYGEERLEETLKKIKSKF